MVVSEQIQGLALVCLSLRAVRKRLLDDRYIGERPAEHLLPCPLHCGELDGMAAPRLWPAAPSELLRSLRMAGREIEQVMQAVL